MRWVKASERMPDWDDKNVVDELGRVVQRLTCRRTKYVFLDSRNEDTFDHHGEWLEDWNVQAEPQQDSVTDSRGE